MLDVVLDRVTLRLLHDVSVTFARSECTAVIGPPASGASTLLAVAAGTERPDSGRVQIGSRDVTAIRADRRPLLYATAGLDVPGRWSVEHALVNAVRGRSLDREDRLREIRLAIEKWSLHPDRRLDTLSDSERTIVALARIELRKPAILIADRLLRDARHAADDWYRTLRVLGTTVITAPSSASELGLTDRVVVLDGGRVAQQGTTAHVYARPVSVAAAAATGIFSAIPVVVRGNAVRSPIGEWTAEAPGFEGEGFALVRPDDFVPARRDEESDLIFGIEEASFEEGRWIASGLVSGGTILRVALPRGEPVYKGRVLALRFDPASLPLVRG